MVAGADYDREWLAPLNEEGQLPHDSLDHVIGQHTGMYAILNVANPQPDFEYSHALNTDQGRMLARMRGGQIVQAGDPETAFSGSAEGSSNHATPLDSAVTFGDVVLVRTPIEKRRLELDEHERRSRAMLRNAGADFIDKATDAEHDVRYNHGAPTRFMRGDHMLTFEDTGGRTVDQWTPDSGIIRERKSDY